MRRRSLAAFPLIEIFVVILLALSTNAWATVSLGMFIQVSGIASGNLYSADPAPSFYQNDPSFQFSTGVISSADQQWKLTSHVNGWRSQPEPEFSSAQELLKALEQPWTISLDQGLPTARQYTMSLNLGSLPATDLTPPVMLFPLPGSTIDSLTSTFNFTPPGLNVPITASLQHFSVTDAQVSLPAGSTQWSLPVPLIDDTQYYFDLAVNGNAAGLAFTDPVDAQGNAIPGWYSYGNFRLESSGFFSTPEPGLGALFGIGAIVLLIRPRQRVRK